MNIKRILDRSVNILLYICVFLVPIPSSFLGKVNQIFLIMAILYILISIAWLYKEHKLREIILKGKMYFALLFLVSLISTVKYIAEILSAKNTTFFMVYQMVIYVAFGFFVFAKIYIDNRIVDKILPIYTYTMTALILMGQNKFLYDLGHYRFEGGFKNPNILALYAVIAVMLLISMICRKSGILIINEICIGICVGACLLSKSRGGMLGLAAGMATAIVMTVVVYGENISRKAVLVVAKRTALIMIVLFITLFAMSPAKTKPNNSNNIDIIDTDEGSYFHDERFSLESTSDSSIMHNLRYTIWIEYAKKMPDYFWFGTDYSLNNRPEISGSLRDAHNTFIYFLFRFGIFVLLSVILLFVYIIFSLLKMNRSMKNTSVIAIEGAFVSLLIISLINDLADTALYYFVIAIVHAYIYFKNNRDKTGKINILQIYSTLDKGGAESRIMDIYRILDRNSIQFDFVVTSPNPEQQFFYGEVKKLGGEVYEIVSWRRAGFINLFVQWRKIFENKEYAAVHSNTAIDSGILLFFAWLNNVPIRIAHARNGGTYDVSGLRKILLFIFKVMTIVFSTHKLYCSEESARHVYGRSYKIMPNTYFVPNSIDLSLYQKPDDDILLRIKNELKIPKCEYIVGTVGNARTVKNHIFLVKVFKKLLEINPNVILLIVGRNDKDQEAKKYVKENKIEDKVFFVGQRDDIPQLLHIFDAFVLPSLSEGAPGSIIEAQAAGVPCILSDSITRAVDAGCGLVKYISLNDDMSKWAGEILLSCQIKSTDIDFIHSKLYQKGYDVSVSADKLIKVYRSGR